MKKLYYLFFLLIISLWTFTCKSSQKSNQVKTQKQKKDSVPSANSVTESDTNKYRITVSFYSKGNGTDSKMKEKYKKFIQEFEQIKEKKIIYDITIWGEEGETDYCFKLSELDIKDQAQFVNESKALLKESSLVNIEVNTICRYKK